MKNMFKYVAVMAMAVALTGLTACEPEPEPAPDPTPDVNPFTESAVYAFHYDGRILKAGDTVVYNLTDADLQHEEAKVDFVVENKSAETQSSVLKIEKVKGPDSMNSIFFCHGTCNEVTCPHTTSAFQLEPGLDPMAISIEFYPTERTGVSATYSLTVGKGRNLDEPQVVFVTFNL